MNSLDISPSPSQEDEDLLERSVKKSKVSDKDLNMNMEECVPETPFLNVIVEQQSTPTAGYEKGVGIHLDQPPRISYSEMLAGNSTQPHRKDPGDSIRGVVYPDSHDDVYDKEEDKDYCPLICLTKEEKKSLRDRWRQSLIVKLWGRKIGYNFLQKKLQSMWRPKAFMDLVALENDYFLVRFHSKQDFEFARDQGPWSILDHYLVVKEQSPDFDPTTNKTEKLIVWVRIPCLPIEYFDYDFLKKVGEKIGKPIRADHNTGMAARGRYARICVEVDITKPLLTMFKLKRRVRHIEYEGLHLVCFECGIVGHKKEDCKKLRSEVDRADDQFAGESGVTVNGETFIRKVHTRKETMSENTGEANFGPWMIAQKKNTRYGKARYGRYGNGDNQGTKEGKKVESGRNYKESDKVEIRSRFNALYDLEEEDKQENNNETNEPKSGVKKAHYQEVKNKKQSKRGKSPIPYLNTVEVGQANSGETHEINNNNNIALQQEKPRSKLRQAATETEHTVVRGKNKGQIITRITVTTMDDTMDEEEAIPIDEHHNDPSNLEELNDITLMEMEDGYGVYMVQEGLDPGGRIAI